MKTRKMLTILVLALGLIASVANADIIWGTPTKVPNVNSAADESNPEISADGLVLFFSSDQTAGYGSTDIWVATRQTTDDGWGTPVNLGPPINTSAFESQPSISADGLHLYLSDGRWSGEPPVPHRPGGHGGGDLWVATRATTNDPWGEPVNLGPTVNSSAGDCDPSISADGLALFFHSERPGGYGSCDLYVTMRPTTSDPWEPPVNIGPPVNSSIWDGDLEISADGLTLFFNSWNRPGGYGASDIWVTTRATTSDPWAPPVNLGPNVNTSICDADSAVSGDGSTLYFARGVWGTAGTWDIWQVSIIPIVDFNGDGIVDSLDMCIMVDHWGTDDPLCDIGPTPLGDGVVDVEDIKVLAEHLFEELNDPTLITHWALDEPEGDVAYDSTGVNDAFVVGGAAWQPSLGQVDGALQLNGVDGCAVAGPVLNPADGPFSVLAWIKGGAPGQAVISQQGAANWLMDDAEGNLMTGLKGSGRDAAELTSQAIITDDDWHRICFVWDGVNRILYVDSIAVAQDTQDGLGGSDSGLYIGCGKAMEAGTYWSGLIDDVRIYNRVVIP